MSNLCPWDPPRALDTDLQNFWRGGRLEFSTSHQNFVWSPAIPCNAKKLFVDMCCFGSKIKLITKAGCLEFLDALASLDFTLVSQSVSQWVIVSNLK